MSVNANAQYTKIGATFASGDEAYADKSSLYGPELTASVADCYATMLTNGVLLEPVSYTWDQATELLTVVKVVTSVEAYKAAVTFDTAAVATASTEAGWTFVPE